MAAEAKDARGDLERIESAHRLILGLLGDLDAVEEPAQIGKLLDPLAQVLPGHFSDEEGPNGLYEELQAARPANHSRLRALEREHREILQALEELRRQWRDPERDLDRIKRAKTAFIQRVRCHEEAETCLYMDTYLVDEGGPG
jgi:hemerythrin